MKMVRNGLANKNKTNVLTCHLVLGQILCKHCDTISKNLATFEGSQLFHNGVETDKSLITQIDEPSNVTHSISERSHTRTLHAQYLFVKCEVIKTKLLALLLQLHHSH